MNSTMNKEIAKPTPFLKGGKVGETGTALVHKDEIIVPAKRVPMNFSQESNTSPSLNTFSKLTDSISELIGVTKNNKPHKPWAKWETTSLYR